MLLTSSPCCDRYVSRDRNVVQFYGACVQENNLLLVAEMMEVRTCHCPPGVSLQGWLHVDNAH